MYTYFNSMHLDKNPSWILLESVGLFLRYHQPLTNLVDQDTQVFGVELPDHGKKTKRNWFNFFHCKMC